MIKLIINLKLFNIESFLKKMSIKEYKEEKFDLEFSMIYNLLNKYLKDICFLEENYVKNMIQFDLEINNIFPYTIWFFISSFYVVEDQKIKEKLCKMIKDNESLSKAIVKTLSKVNNKDIISKQEEYMKKFQQSTKFEYTISK